MVGIVGIASILVFDKGKADGKTRQQKGLGEGIG